MLSTSSLVIVIALGLIVFYWQFRMHSKELAITHAKRICKNYQLQLLDQSISFTKISVEKRFGKWCLVKIFEFDYADNLQHRKTATLVFHKNNILIKISGRILENFIKISYVLCWALLVNLKTLLKLEKKL